MKQNTLLVGIIGLFLGIGLTYVFMAQNTLVSKDHVGQMNTNQPVTQGEHGENMTMTDMTKALQGKTGDAFDTTFIEMMIDHHQGAIDMANLAKIQAKHTEIQTMADDIINAQTKEIQQMRQWYNAWGYAK